MTGGSLQDVSLAPLKARPTTKILAALVAPMSLTDKRLPTVLVGTDVRLSAVHVPMTECVYRHVPSPS